MIRSLIFAADFSFCGIILDTRSNALADDVHDVVLLNNGAKVIGTIIEDGRKNEIIIRTLDGKTVKISRRLVAEITRTNTDYLVRQKSILDSVKAAKQNYDKIRIPLFHFQFPMNTSDKITTLGMSAKVELFPQKHMTVAFGAGIDWFETGRLIPLMGECTYYLTKTRWRPYAFSRAGYAFSSRRRVNYVDNTGGPRWGLGAGIQMQLNARTATTLEFGFTHQRISYEYGPSRQYPDMISAAFGIKF